MSYNTYCNYCGRYRNTSAVYDPPKTSDWKLSEFTSIRNNDKTSDVTVLVNGKVFKLHKVILAARSPVFHKILDKKQRPLNAKRTKRKKTKIPTHQLQEERENVLEIVDFTAEVMEEVIQYIYTGDPPKKLKNLTEELLRVADKYDLSGLKKLCLEELKSRLNNTCASSLLISADTHHLTCLKELVMNYILSSQSSVQSVLSLSSWKNLEISHPHLAQEIYKSSTMKFVTYMAK